MPGLYTEADYENSVVELFKNMGYTYVYGPDIERDFRSPLYDDVLVESLHRINKGLPEDAITDALYKLKNSYGDFIISTKAALLGWSAGAHLALMYTYTRSNTAIPIKLAVSEAGPVDMYDDYADNNYTIDPELAYPLELMTGIPCSSVYFRNALYDLSPALQVTSSLPADINTIIAYGNYELHNGIPWDQVITKNQATNLGSALTSLGKPVSLVELTGINHLGVLGYLPGHTSSAYYTAFTCAVSSFMAL